MTSCLQLAVWKLHLVSVDFVLMQILFAWTSFLPNTWSYNYITLTEKYAVISLNVTSNHFVFCREYGKCNCGIYFYLNIWNLNFVQCIYAILRIRKIGIIRNVWYANCVLLILFSKITLTYVCMYVLHAYIIMTKETHWKNICSAISAEFVQLHTQIKKLIFSF